VTTTQNFVLAIPNTPNGTMKLSRGNIGATTQDIFTVDSSGNLTATNNLNVSGSMTIAGGLTLSANATTALQPVTKQQFDNLIVTFGSGAGTVFSVWPPSGYVMGNLIGFIPSINQIHFNGDVDNNDSLYCYTNYYGDHMDIVVYNSEQRATPYANYLAIWKK